MKLSRVRILTALASLALLAANLPQTSAAYIQWRPEDGGNGHYYGLVMPDIPADSLTWTQARDAADSTTFLGSTGHLVTVTSAAESEFLKQQFASQLFDNFPDPTDRKYAWIGLFAPTETSSFQWVTGEPVTYTDWAQFEPNYFGSSLWQYAHYWTRDFGSGPTWTWNNDKNDGFNPPFNSNGYIVEFDGPFTATAPEPTSFALMATGLALVSGRSALRKFRRR